ncbi:UNVERIFIED_CONTAM: cytochrome and DOMON domain-containing protein [Sesamum latifolium]|uniref:Cytochrome and DOMON domain-containing protein n=1 Tax=Sesamum latifolium TaxID=2727402 RepID=A0AAW2WU56_9LAMI
MDKFSKLFLILISSFLLFAPSQAQDCRAYTFSNNAHRGHNLQLGSLGAQSRHRSHGRSPEPDRFPQLDRPRLRLHLPDYGLFADDAAGDFELPVPSVRAEFVDNQMIVYATIELPPGRTSFTHVWQHGDLSGDAPQAHPFSGDHLSSYGAIDFATGRTINTGAAGEGSRQRKRNVHGVLNVVSWGILMPLGAMAARYLKVFKAANPAWFYLHVTCQASAYIVGVAGWGTGLKLGSDSPGVERTTHRNIGITLFALGTLQVFALLLRPKPDHKYRFYWNIYHHVIGYTVISLSIANIFEGFDILDPEKKWKQAYIGVLIFLGVNAVLLEAFTWFVLKRKRESGSDKYPHAGNGMNGVNGYGA